MITPEELEMLKGALTLQTDIRDKLMSSYPPDLGNGKVRDELIRRADVMATDLMDMVLRSDAIKPEIKAYYLKLEQQVQDEANTNPASML